MNMMIIGAGMSGLTAARTLQDMGHTVTVLDKGRGVGGRMATRRIDDAVFDHGAQFLTARSEWFIGAVDEWMRQGVVAPWFGMQQERQHIRYRGVASMNAVAKHLAKGLDVRTSTTVRALHPDASSWRIEVADAEALHADACIVTAPVEQALALVDVTRLDVDADELNRLRRLSYHPCMALMVTLDGSSGLPSGGPFTPEDSDTIALIADNFAKGISHVACLTVHSTPEFALRYLEQPEQAQQILVQQLRRYVKAEIVHSVIHRWRFAQPSTQHMAPFSTLNSTPPLLLAGDAFGGARIEGAALSGLAAANHLSTL